MMTRTLCVLLALLSLLVAGAAAEGDNLTINATGVATPAASPTAELLWQTTYDGSASSSLLALLPGPEGGYLLVGTSTGTAGGNGELTLVRTDGSGAHLRSSRLPFGLSGSGRANAASLTRDGGVAAVGSTRSVAAGDEDVFLLRLRADGTSLWGRSYAIGSGIDVGDAVVPATDGGLFVAGTTASPTGGTTGLLLLKVDEAGGQVWHRVHSLGASRLIVHDLQATSDGGYLLVGSTDANHPGSLDVLLMKFTAGGSREWQQTFAAGSGSAVGYALEPSPDGGYVLLGAVEGSGTPSPAVVLIGTDTAGRERWRTRLAVGNATPTRGFDLGAVGDRGYLVVGETGASAATRSFAALVDRSGRELWNRTYSVGEATDGARALTVAGAGRYVVAGNAASSADGSSRLYLVAVSPSSAAPNTTTNATRTANATPTFTANTTPAVTATGTPVETAPAETTGSVPTRAPLGIVPALASLAAVGLRTAFRRR